MFFLQAHLRMDEALAHLRAAAEVDPLSPLLHADLAHLFYLRREFGPAMEEAQHALALDPRFPLALAVVGMVCVAGGRAEEIVSFAREMEAVMGDNPVMLGGMGWGLASAGMTEPARQILEALKMPGRYDRKPLFCISWIHHGLGKTDAALDWLERAVEERDPKIVFLPTKPFWDGLRPAPRFQRLLRKMRLA